MKSPAYLWANALLAEAIEGACDSFLIVVGGSAISQGAAIATPSVTPKQIALSVVLGAAIYVASFLKKTPLPSSMPVAPAPAAPIQP